MVKASAQTNKPARTDGASTKTEMVKSALATLSAHGYAACTARKLAQDGNYNQALVFYHFGGVDGLLMAALHYASENRLARYQAKVAGVEGTRPMLDAVRELWQEDNAAPDIAAIRELVSTQAFAKNRTEDIADALSPWFELAESVLGRAISGTPLVMFLKPKDAAFLAVSIVMGAETMHRLGLGDDSVESLFNSAAAVIPILESISNAGEAK